jgi:hypothetical protein
MLIAFAGLMLTVRIQNLLWNDEQKSLFREQKSLFS